MTKADELWEKYANDESSRGGPVMCIGDFLAALQEYGESVRQQAVSVCINKIVQGPTAGPEDAFRNVGIADCAAAIEKMEIK